MKSDRIDSNIPLNPFPESNEEPTPTRSKIHLSSDEEEHAQRVNIVWDAVQENCRKLYHDLKKQSE